MIISGDFRHTTLDSTLAAFYQVVNCPTRNNRTIDLLYVNVQEAYRVTPLPSLRKCDHNLVHLQPQYTPLVQGQPATPSSIRRWSLEMEAALRDCYGTTDWDVLLNPHCEDIEGMTYCLTDYFNFCVNVVSTIRTVRCYPNNKPLVTREVKAVLNRKKAAFRSRDKWRLVPHEQSAAQQHEDQLASHRLQENVGLIQVPRTVAGQKAGLDL